MDFDTLIQQPESRRDEAWEAQFLDSILTMKVAVVQDTPQTGPDGWPYLPVRTGGETIEPFIRIVRWLSGRGIGLVVNPHKMVPDYVFTYGMIWNYIENGRFVLPLKPSPAGQVVLEEGQKMVMGAPTEKYLPSYVRSVIREFLAAQGFPDPKILVISSPDYKSIDLAFSLDSLPGVSEQGQKALADALAWFLPLHYSLAFLPERNLPPFHPL